MAMRDYILCKNCKCKLIPDGYDLVRDHLEEKWGNPEANYYTPMLLCPDCIAALEREVGAFCEDSVLTIAERTFSTEIDEQLAEDLIQFAQRLHSRWVTATKEQSE